VLHKCLPFISAHFFSVQVTLASLQGVRGLIRSWPAGTFLIMSVPEAGANEQDVLLINPGRVFDRYWTCVWQVAFDLYHVMTAGDHKGPPSHASPPSPLLDGYFLWKNLSRFVIFFYLSRCWGIMWWS